MTEPKIILVDFCDPEIFMVDFSDGNIIIIITINIFRIFKFRNISGSKPFRIGVAVSALI